MRPGPSFEPASWGASWSTAHGARQPECIDHGATWAGTNWCQKHKFLRVPILDVTRFLLLTGQRYSTCSGNNPSIIVQSVNVQPAISALSFSPRRPRHNKRIEVIFGMEEHT